METGKVLQQFVTLARLAACLESGLADLVRGMPAATRGPGLDTDVLSSPQRRS